VLVTAVILERPTCLICVCAKVGATQLDVVRAMERVGETVRMEVLHDERCRACGSTLGPVYALRANSPTRFR
jgi:hypothetical protein